MQALNDSVWHCVFIYIMGKKCNGWSHSKEMNTSQKHQPMNAETIQNKGLKAKDIQIS